MFPNTNNNALDETEAWCRAGRWWTPKKPVTIAEATTLLDAGRSLDRLVEQAIPRD